MCIQEVKRIITHIHILILGRIILIKFYLKVRNTQLNTWKMLLKRAFFLLSIMYIGLITENEGASISNGKVRIFDNNNYINVVKNVIAGAKF